MNKDLVENPLSDEDLLDPADADHQFNVKVMLMATPPAEDFFEKTCLLAGASKYSTFKLISSWKVSKPSFSSV